MREHLQVTEAKLETRMVKLLIEKQICSGSSMSLIELESRMIHVENIIGLKLELKIYHLLPVLNLHGRNHKFWLVSRLESPDLADRAETSKCINNELQ